MTEPVVVRAFRIHQTGGPEQLTLDQIELPPPGPGQARVRHTAVGVNYIDTYHRGGLYPLPMPATLGSEAAGVIEALGEGVTELLVGQRVGYAVAGPGAYADARVPVSYTHLRGACGGRRRWRPPWCGDR